jgi:hypothetical protein
VTLLDHRRLASQLSADELILPGGEAGSLSAPFRAQRGRTAWAVLDPPPHMRVWNVEWGVAGFPRGTGPRSRPQPRGRAADG